MQGAELLERRNARCTRKEVAVGVRYTCCRRPGDEARASAKNDVRNQMDDLLADDVDFVRRGIKGKEPFGELAGVSPK